MRSIIAILPNIRSLYNIGAIFRTAEACELTKIILTGYSGCPDRQPKIHKTALGAQNFVPWEYHYHAWRVIEQLKSQGYQIIAMEQTATSQDFRKFRFNNKIALIMGNEVAGVSKSLLTRADHIVHLPMYGRKQSLNVAAAFGIISYYLTFTLNQDLLY